MSNDFAEQLLLYQSNIIPALLHKFAQQLHVNAKSLLALEIGYALRIPLKKGKEFRDCWVFPERDECGNVIGLSLRSWDGKKFMVPGSKRGLIYVPNIHRSCTTQPERYQAGPQNWTRTSTEIPCPVCKKTDWCMVSSERPEDPRAVLCCRVREGASRDLGTAGYLHIRKLDEQVAQAGSVLISSEYPILVVEGATDVAAALNLGLIAVGRPGSTGCLDKLAEIIAGRKTVIIGENDAGAGKEGMDKTFDVLQPHVKELLKLLPPEGIKDFRQWIIQGLTKQQFLEQVKLQGDSTGTQTLLVSVAPVDLAKQWLEATYNSGGIYTLRLWHTNWYAYDGQCYQNVERNHLRKLLYRFLSGKQFRKVHGKGYDVCEYEPTKYKVDQIIDALLTFCPIDTEEVPCWLDVKHTNRNPRHILTFPNGYLDIDQYTQGVIQLNQLDPLLFALTCYPYEFNEHATCALWLRFLEEIFGDDPLKISLLQEWFGYNLIPDNSYEKFMMFLGPTRAGKSTILDVLSFILGSDQVIATSLKDFTRRFALYPFVGKHAALIGDVSVNTNYDPTEALNLLKRITGNDIVTIEQKGKDITRTCIKLYTRFTLAANTMPRLPDFARTIESRMLVIQFLTSFAGKEDTTLKTRLKTEAPGILLWALKGLKRLQQNRIFTLPATHAQVLKRIRNDITPLVEFVDDYCILADDAESYITTDHLYEGWKHWAIKNGEKPYATRWVQRSITSLYPSCEVTRMMINNQRRRVIRGIKFYPEVQRELFGI